MKSVCFNSLVRRLVCISTSLLALGLGSFPLLAAARPVFDLRSGDKVVLIGDTLIEREQSYGYLEERLTVRFPDRDVHFRNLGWSADTPEGISRASFDFDKPGKGFEQLTNQIAIVQPNVVIIGYGMANSFQGEAGLAQFKTGLNKLVDAIQTICTNKPVRFVFLSPVHHENLGAPLPDPTGHNQQLALYTRAVADVAAERNSLFISLYNNLIGDGTQTHPPQPVTENGIHYSAYGYLRMAEAVEKAFVWEPNLWRVEITADGQVTPVSYGTTVNNLELIKNQLQFTLLDSQLVSPFISGKDGRLLSADAPSLIQIDGLRGGRYELKVDGDPIVTATAKEWQRGVAIDRGPQFDQAEELRHAILKKNELFFDRWRPENETYLFGFRQHEQGQNAKEIPMFDPLIAEQEAKIAKLRQPVPHTYELVPAARSRAVKVANDEELSESAESALPAPKTEQTLPVFDIAPGFEVSLYAESPLLAKPIQMNFDPRGRLWVVSSSVYPQIQPGQNADDKVLVLEDTKGVGKVDKSTVFADGLLIPTGVEPGDGGVYVGQGTQLLFFKDTTGSGKADQKRIVLSGFGTEDTHHIVHTLHWGYDGQLYFDQSIYIHSHIETPNGVERLNSGGIWHLRPATMELGVYLRGFCNPWGHQFDEFGQSFVTDGAGSQGLSWGIPGATYFTYADMRRELKSISPGSYPKFASLEIIRSRQFPDDWQGNAITCDFRAHRVVRFAIDEKDSGYATREMPDLLRTTNVTFRQIDVKLGPDGALYIADWSNPIIQHGEVDFRDPRRDHEHGRIWRVTAKGRPLLKRVNFEKASNRELLDQLVSPDEYNQHQARRVLTERGLAILGDLVSWTRNQNNEGALLQALWMYQSINVAEPALLEKLLNARDGHVRAAATRVVSYWHPRLPNAMDLLAERVADGHPRVRVEALRALAEIPSARSAELVLGALDKPMDAFLDYAVWLSINDLAEPWVAAVKSGAWKTEGREKQLEFALKAIEPARASEMLAQVLQSRTLSRDGSGPWIELIGKSGDEAEVRRLFEQAASGGFDDEAAARVLKAVAEAGRSRGVGKSGDVEKLAVLFKSSDVEIQTEALRLAGVWKQPAAVSNVIAVIRAKDSRPGTVRVAFETLREIGGREAMAQLPALINESESRTVRREAVVAFAALDMEQAKPEVVALLNDVKIEAEGLELWRSLLGIKGAAGAIAKALPKSGLPAAMAKAGLRAAREGGRNEPELVVALTRGANLEEGLGLTDAEMKQMAERALQTGDPVRGETIFRRKEIGCINCHAIGGVGGKVGPDLTSIGASAQADYLIESVFYPNRKIKEGYHSVLVETKDGEELSGVVARENTEQLVLRDATDKEITIPKSSIKSRALGNSLMPAGLVDTLSSAQQLDLFRFLAELGKPGPFDASKGNVARAWKLCPQTVDINQFGDEKILNSRLSDAGWSTAFTLVNGRLLKGEFESALEPVKSRYPGAIFAAVQAQVSGGEPFGFKLSGCGPETPVWLDGKLIKTERGTDGFARVTALPGVHTFMLKLDTAKLPDYIQLEASGGTFLIN
ncbi:MAG: hypothetical protein JWQ04_1689 [Pedosphaera sp.]|nr:hypothetical protein [Pedosphaera sp.]